MKVKTRHITVNIIEDNSGREFEVEHTPSDYIDPIVKDCKDGRVVVGYLVDDEDYSNPLEDCEGMGKIYDRRNLSTNEQCEVNVILGLDQYGEPDEDAQPNKYAVILDVYSHSVEIWSLHGAGMNCRWDTSHGAGVWVPDPSCLEHIETMDDPMAEAIKCAKQAVDTYNSWLSGEVYGVCVEVFEETRDGWKRVDSNSCWGHVGCDNAVSSLEEEVEAIISNQ